MRFLGLQSNKKNQIAMPRHTPVTRTNTPYPGKPDRALGNITRGNESGRQISAHSRKTDASQNQTRPKPRNFVKLATYDDLGI